MSQYEAQLRRWDSQKNLKRNEWAFLLAQYDKIIAQGCQARIVSSGLPLNEARIARARRHLQKTKHTLSITTAPRHAFVERQDHRGGWSRHATAECDNPRLIRQPRTGNRATLEWPNQSTASTGTGLVAHEESAGLALISVPEHWDLLPPRESIRPVGSLRNAQVSIERSSYRDLVARPPLNPLHIAIGPVADVFIHPISQQMLGHLSTLVPNNAGTGSLTLCGNGVGSDIPTLVKAIAYSYSNRMELSRTTDRDTVFQLLKQSESLRQGLHAILQAVHPSFGMCLADNLFRSAVEAGDAQALKMVLHMARSRFAYVIDPNRVKCAIPDRIGQYTPLETAASKRNIELVQMLLQIGADPNHSYWKELNHSQGALESALRKFPGEKAHSEPQLVNAEMVRLLLAHRAKVRPETLRLLLQYPLIEMELVRDVIEHIEVEDHLLYFPDTEPEDENLEGTPEPLHALVGRLIPDIAHIFQNSVAVSATKAFFQKCDAEACGFCTTRHEKEVIALLQCAAWRGNLELVEFILPMAPYASLQNLLVAGIRSGNKGLINYLLENSATVDGPASGSPSVFGGYIWDEKLPFLSTSTPLSEAILCQDEELINRLEKLGALSTVGVRQGDHFRAATTAAAFTANIRYLHKLCATVPEMDGKYLTNALTAAIVRNNYDAVCFLLFHTQVEVKVESLQAAIYIRNEQIFDLLVEFTPTKGHYYGGDGPLYTGMLTYAASWGNIEVLGWLKRLGVSTNHRAGNQNGLYQIPSVDGLSPLMFAILAGDMEALKWVLTHGADPCVMPEHGESPLALAALCADVEMVRLLLAHKASVKDNLAFVFAMKYSREILEILLSVFASQFPDGIPGFGRMALARAISEGQNYDFNRLLQARMDVSTLTEGCSIRNVLYGIAAYNIRKRDTVDQIGRNVFGRGREGLIQDRISEEKETLEQLIGMSALGYAIQFNSQGNSGYHMVRNILEAGGDPNSFARSKPLATPLLLAIEHGNIELMELLLEWGADVNRPALRGVTYTPLQLASKLGRLEMVEFLLQRGADTRAEPSLVGGGTALQMAARSGNIKIAQLLLDNGANVHESPSKVRGRTAFEGAAKEGRITMLEFLWTQACPAGFPPAELERAKSFAEEEGHRGCVEYIDLLLMIVGDARTPRLSSGY